MIADIAASASPVELLALDAEAPLMDLAGHPLWQAALGGSLPAHEMRALVLALYPALAGPGRYAFFAKVSKIGRKDGEELFRQLHLANTDSGADADKGWRKVAAALGVPESELDAALESPCAEAADFVETVREHGLRSSPAAAAAVAWVIERPLPKLLGRLADSLVSYHGLAEADVAYLRYEAGRESEVKKWVDHLIAAYFEIADAYTVFEARRAAREAVWAWTALTESIR